jgi:purine-binding chemotaxis protein CheW
MRVLLLHIRDDVFAVPMAAALEVVVAPKLAALPTAPANVAGLINLRGDIVPVFDTAMLLGLGTIPSIAFVAVVETSLGPAGLAMTEVGESVELGESMGVTDAPGTLATYALGTKVAVMIDIETLLAPAGITT